MTATNYISRYACPGVIDAQQQYRPYYDNYKRRLISQRGPFVIGFVGCEYLAALSVLAKHPFYTVLRTLMHLCTVLYETFFERFVVSSNLQSFQIVRLQMYNF